MKNEIMFSEYMTGLGEIFDKKITDVLKNLYWKALEPFTDDQCKKAFNRVMAKSKWFPKPADLIEAIEADKPQIESVALVQANNIVAHLQQWGSTKWPALDDTITHHLMTRRWKYDIWAKDVLESELKWWVKEFVRAYLAYSEAYEMVQIEDVLDRIKPLIENIGG